MKGTSLWKAVLFEKRLPYRYEEKIRNTKDYFRFKLNELNFFFPYNIGKRKILLIANIPNWAWDIKSNEIKRNLKNYYNFNIAYSDYKDVLKKINFSKYDLIVTYIWSDFNYLKHLFAKTNKICLGVSSMEEVDKKREKRFLKLAKKADAVFVHNKLLFKQLKDKVDKIYYCPNGVNTDRFYPNKNIENKEKLTVGFVGNSKSGKEKLKGLYDIIIPSVRGLKNVKIKYIDYVKGKIISHKKMPDFYNSIDCYICASTSEGTPNPCLEAAACGRPLITTKVGNMIDLVKDKENSLFFDRSIKNLKKKIKYYRDNKNKLIEHGENIKREIIENWDWKKNSQNFKKMFDEVLNDK